MISTFTAFVDSNVFYGARLRSLLLYLAQTGLYRARWSEDVHREWISNLLKNRADLTEASLARTKQQMNDAVLDCVVENYADLIPSLNLPDPNDRHILAAAVRGHAETIVTFNEMDFPAAELSKYDIQTRHPDDFIMDLINIDEECCFEQIQEDITHYKAPPLTFDNYVDSLEKASLPKTAAFLRGVKIIFK